MTANQEGSLFCIASNGRSGSVYLSTSLAQVPDVGCEYELQWERASGFGPSDETMVRRSLTVEDIDVATFLRELKYDAKHRGSRLVLPPGGAGILHKQHYIDELCARFKKDIKIIHLSRNYFDVLKSSLARIGLTALTERGLKLAEKMQSKEEGVVPNMDFVNSIHDSYQNEDDTLRWGIEPARCQAVLAHIITNEISLIALARHVDESMHVEFHEIGDRFPEILDFIGVDISRDHAKAILDRPMTRKLNAIPDDCIQNHEAIKEACADAYASVRKIIDQDIDLNDVIRGDELRMP